MFINKDILFHLNLEVELGLHRDGRHIPEFLEKWHGLELG